MVVADNEIGRNMWKETFAVEDDTFAEASFVAVGEEKYFGLEDLLVAN